MLRKHIDLVAVLFIGIAMFAVSQEPALTTPVEAKTVRFQSVTNTSDSCRIMQEILASLASILDQ